VESDELVPGSETRRVDEDSVPAVAARADRPRPKLAKTARVASTFRSVAEGVRRFESENQAAFDAAEPLDLLDGLRDWMDRIEVGRRRSRKLSRTPAGQRILEAAQRSGPVGLRAAVAYLLGRAPGRRWAAVPWREVRGLSEMLEHAGSIGFAWYPESDQADETAERFASNVAALAKAFEAQRPELAPAARRVWSRRLRQLRELARDPSRLVLESGLCVAELEGACSFPALEDARRALGRGQVDLDQEEPAAADDIDLPWENPSRALKRPPLPSLDGAELTDLLGQALEVELASGHVLRWARGSNVLAWHPEARACVWFQGARAGRRKKAAPRGKAAETFGRWTGRRASGETTLCILARDAWRRIGTSTRLDYRSKKWPRRGPEYTHATTTRPTLYRMGGGKPPWVWVLKGGGLQLTKDGLIG
jgi:hypothetical protein